MQYAPWADEPTIHSISTPATLQQQPTCLNSLDFLSKYTASITLHPIPCLYWWPASNAGNSRVQRAQRTNVFVCVMIMRCECSVWVQLHMSVGGRPALHVLPIGPYTSDACSVPDAHCTRCLLLTHDDLWHSRYDVWMVITRLTMIHVQLLFISFSRLGQTSTEDCGIQKARAGGGWWVPLTWLERPGQIT